MSVKAALIVSAIEQYAAEVREAYSALREAEAQAEKAEKRAVDARKATEMRRMDLGRALLRARGAYPERGPKAKGWGEFLEKEGISQSTAWRYMEMAGGKVSFTDGRLTETPHPADMKGELAAHPGVNTKPFGKVLDMQLLLGTWEDMIGEVGKVDTIITDPPYSERTHSKSRDGTREDGWDDEGLAPNYEHWTAKDIDTFVGAWAPKCRGWMVALTDHHLIGAWTDAYERHGRYSFAPVPCVIQGMSVRLIGDGPSSWAVYAMVSRPSSREFSKWGTLPGAYHGGREPGSKNGRGKPRWLTDALVHDYSRPNDLVCDPLAGYGGTLVSALLQGRRAIGVEQDEEAVREAFARATATQQSAA